MVNCELLMGFLRPTLINSSTVQQLTIFRVSQTAMNKHEWKTAVCPECGLSIQFSTQPVLYHLLLCPQCETLLVVTAVAPLKLDWAFEEPDGSEINFKPFSPRPFRKI
jgi:hypothetical protein